MVDDTVALFTNARVDRTSVPENLFCYDIRHDDECQGEACEIKPIVLINHWGTIIRRLIANIKVVSADKLLIQFQSGIVMEQEISYD